MLELPKFPRLIYKFLMKQLHPDTPGIPLIQNDRKMRVFYSATATFCAPSNPSGVQSIQREQIHTAPSWRNGAPCYYCAFIASGAEDDPLHRFDVCQVFLFLPLSTRIPLSWLLASWQWHIWFIWRSELVKTLLIKALHRFLDKIKVYFNMLVDHQLHWLWPVTNGWFSPHPEALWHVMAEQFKLVQ